MSSKNPRPPRLSPLTAVLAVILFLAGITAVVLSLWMQELPIRQGAQAYGELAEQLKTSFTTATPVMAETLLATEAETTFQLTETSRLPVDVSEPPSVVPMEFPTAAEHPEPSPKAAFSLACADLAACQAVNGDFIGWLQIPGTKVDYPVVLTNDVAYYLNHTFTRQENIIGCLFSLGKTDYQSPSRNIAVFGHHMRRSRETTMFQPLHNYKSDTFRQAHATICFDTLYGSRTYTVFAVINKRERDWDASAADFASDADFQAFIERAKEWSLYDTGLPVNTDAHILTLITCDRNYHADDGQLIVMAVQE